MNSKRFVSMGKNRLVPNGLSSQKEKWGIEYRKPRSIHKIPQGKSEGGLAGENGRQRIDRCRGEGCSHQ
jgi:hypothetical protein